MNKKKSEEKRIKKGLLTMEEHMANRKEAMQKSWSKNPKNKNQKPFNQ